MIAADLRHKLQLQNYDYPVMLEFRSGRRFAFTNIYAGRMHDARVYFAALWDRDISSKSLCDLIDYLDVIPGKCMVKIAALDYQEEPQTVLRIWEGPDCIVISARTERPADCKPLGERQ